MWAGVRSLRSNGLRPGPNSSWRRCSSVLELAPRLPRALPQEILPRAIPATTFGNRSNGGKESAQLVQCVGLLLAAGQAFAGEACGNIGFTVIARKYHADIRVDFTQLPERFVAVHVRRGQITSRTMVISSLRSRYSSERLSAVVGGQDLKTETIQQLAAPREPSLRSRRA